MKRKYRVIKKPPGQRLDLSQIGTRDRGGWQDKSLEYLEEVKRVLNGLEDYWPLTLRQVYYQLVASEAIENSVQEYKKLSRILSKARLDGLVPWETIEDRSRPFHGSHGFQNADSFVEYELQDFLSGYRRHLTQSQDRVLEVWVEKDALSQVAYRIALPYCVCVAVGRGFSSISYMRSCFQRILENYREKKKTRILYFGDLDPSGWFMPEDMVKTLAGEMGVGEYVEIRRVALLPEQVEEYNLPQNPNAFKEKDPRGDDYRKIHGNLSVELDALKPDVFGELVKRAIEKSLDLSKFEEEQIREEEEREEIGDLKTKVEEFIGREWK